ncbi:MAG: hypothetical protein J2P19_18600 [Pseudonocardia sp.]|nr:hypothetical protein [Pseudonocardia sp.]
MKAPTRRCGLVARFLGEAMICEALAVRTWERFSAKVTSRTKRKTL